jgi:site-specific recombinase XerC
MVMKTNVNLLGPWVRRFLLEHLVLERNLARNTQLSYRDTLTLLLPFASTQAKKSVDRLVVDDLSPATIGRFLVHLEQERHCTIATINGWERFTLWLSLSASTAWTIWPGAVKFEPSHSKEPQGRS